MRAFVGGISVLIIPLVGLAQTPAPINVADLDREIRQRISREMTAHVQDIKSVDPPQDRVVGALTTGEFSWGTFMRALAAYSTSSGTRIVAGRDVPALIGKMGLIEARQGGKAFAQMYAALALESFGADLNPNPLWQSLSPREKDDWRSLLDPGRFYDLKTHRVIDLPENYLGVAARIAAIDYKLGVTKDRAYADDLLDRAARPFAQGSIFSDDAPATGRYDRYSSEYARYVYFAAETAGRDDIKKALEPSLKEQMRLWWELVAPDGYGYPWGRSLGAIGYMDTMEITAFLGTHPQFRPASLSDLASAYYNAWEWLRADLKESTHLLSVFDFGRGDYSYINKEREWQQTTAFFGKVIEAHRAMMQTLELESIKEFPRQVHLADVMRFEFFRQSPDRQMGVWIVRRGPLHFALPFVTGPKAATSDYEPAPHGLPGFAAPVERIYPCLTPFLELEDGRTIAAADGADEIVPAPDGRSVSAVWHRWVVPGAKAGETVEAGLVARVTWSLQANTLHRTETIAATKPVKIRRLWMAFPARAVRSQTVLRDGKRVDRLLSSESALDVQVAQTDWPIQISQFAAGDSPLGRGARGPIPLHLVMESKDLSFDATPKKWEITIAMSPSQPQ
jgi:hypothetical protein